MGKLLLTTDFKSARNVFFLVFTCFILKIYTVYIHITYENLEQQLLQIFVYFIIFMPLSQNIKAIFFLW